MEQFQELNPTQLKLSFAAISIESLARHLGKPYKIVFECLQRTGGIKDFLLGCYESLHTQSREYVNEALIEYLTVRNALP